MNNSRDTISKLHISKLHISKLASLKFLKILNLILSRAEQNMSNEVNRNVFGTLPTTHDKTFFACNHRQNSYGKNYFPKNAPS